MINVTHSNHERALNNIANEKIERNTLFKLLEQASDDYLITEKNKIMKLIVKMVFSENEIINLISNEQEILLKEYMKALDINAQYYSYLNSFLN